MQLHNTHVNNKKNMLGCRNRQEPNKAILLQLIVYNKQLHIKTERQTNMDKPNILWCYTLRHSKNTIKTGRRIFQHWVLEPNSPLVYARTKSSLTVRLREIVYYRKHILVEYSIFLRLLSRTGGLSIFVCATGREHAVMPTLILTTVYK